MPNVNPRISVVLPKSTYATLARLAALQGRSRSAVARDFLVEVEPVLQRIAGMLELASQAQGQWPREFVAKLVAVQEHLEGEALKVMTQLDAFSDQVAAPTPVQSGRTGAGARAASARERSERASAALPSARIAQRVRPRRAK
jgi:hypothetical protein